MALDATASEIGTQADIISALLLSRSDYILKWDTLNAWLADAMITLDAVKLYRTAAEIDLLDKHSVKVGKELEVAAVNLMKAYRNVQAFSRIYMLRDRECYFMENKEPALPNVYLPHAQQLAGNAGDMFIIDTMALEPTEKDYNAMLAAIGLRGEI